MTRNANARLAGFMFLFYIATAFPQMVLMNKATAGTGAAAKLASIAAHASDVRIAIVLTLVTAFDALFLGVALYGLTRDVDHELAVLALLCRALEGMINAVAAGVTTGLLSLATASAAAAAPDPAANALGALLVKALLSGTTVGAACFAMGSTIFAWLFVRGRSIPMWLAWLGVVGSGILVLGLPAHLAGWFMGAGADLMWIPVAVFEIVLGFWLLIKGSATPAQV